MSEYISWDEQLDHLEQGRCKYTWDELEELITDRMDDGLLTEEEYETLMKRLMDIDCDS